jgi:O-antigen ligase
MVFIFILMLVQARKLNLFFFFRSTIFIIIFSFIFFEALNLKLNDLNYVQRIYSNDEITIFKDDNRKELYISAYLQFTKNPIFGDKYFEEITKTYPHNIFLEVLMSTGLVGILFFLLHIFNLVFLYFKNYNIKNNSTFLFYITFFYFSCSLFSSSIWGNLEFFIFSALLIYTLDYINLENA